MMDTRESLTKPADPIRASVSNRKLISLLQPVSSEAGRYHRLRLAIEKMDVTNGARVVAITSPMPGDGKSITSINLAGALARNKRNRVLLVDLDLRHPYTTLGGYLGLGDREEKMRGMVDCVTDGTCRWNDVVLRLPEFNLDVLVSGKSVSVPYEILDAPSTASLFAELRTHYDYIIVDTPPATLVPDCQLIERFVDRFLVVVLAGRTTRDQFDQCLGGMQADQVLGLVFNGVEASEVKDYGY